MRDQPTLQGNTRTAGKAGIWLAIAIAFSLHSVLLLLPYTKQIPPDTKPLIRVELQFTELAAPSTPIPEPVQQSEFIDDIDEMDLEPPELVPDTPAEPETAIVTIDQPPENRQDNPQSLSNNQQIQLAPTILASQFISEDSVTDLIFGKQIVSQITDPKKGFHIPMRENMVSMLNQPMPELPFAYTEGLIRFAYEPGVKGDLQRFWDVITPEFGWRTKNGTEFKCVWVLIIAGCGWK